MTIKEKNRERARKWAKDNPDKAKARSKKWVKENREWVRLRQRNWRKKNYESTKATERRRSKERRLTDPSFCLVRNQRNRIWKALKGIAKSAGTQKLLGCPVELFRLILESQFQAGMTWENYGSVWHVDHIKPCAAFDLSDHAQQKQCFHYSNLQPLWAKENIRKGAKFSPLPK